MPSMAVSTPRKAIYYRADSALPFGPWPADGSWPQKYACRGFYLLPPIERLAVVCPEVDCPKHELPAFLTEREMAQHCAATHRYHLYRVLGTDRVEREPVEAGYPTEEVAGELALAITDLDEDRD